MVKGATKPRTPETCNVVICRRELFWEPDPTYTKPSPVLTPVGKGVRAGGGILGALCGCEVARVGIARP